MNKKDIKQLHIYVIERSDKTYYVGASYELEERLQDHKRKDGKVLFSRVAKSLYEELETTLEMMDRVGIENVYGACFTRPERTKEQIDFIKSIINFVKDKCYKCGKLGHYSNQCRKYSNDKNDDFPF